MNAIKILILVGEVAGVIAGLYAIPFVPPEYGLFIFAGSSIHKDLVNRVGSLVDGSTHSCMRHRSPTR